MGKWLDRVIEKREFKDNKTTDIPKSHTDKTDKTLIVPVRIPQIPPEMDFKEAPLSILDHLDETSREAFREYVDLMTGPKIKMPLEQARKEASQLVIRNLRTLQIRQATKDFRKHGWVKIYSTVLGEAIYWVRDERAAKRVPDRSLPVFLESDIEALKGLAPEEARVLLEARMIFDGPIKIENYSERSPKRKMDGKQIARNFYGKGNDGKKKITE